MAPLAVKNELSTRFRTWNRNRKVAWVRSFCQDVDARSVLLVGVASTGNYAWENLVEESISSEVQYSVWSGLMLRPDKQFVLCDGRRLPFADNAFDLVFSNAVVEHVGDEDDQALFVSEHARVGRSWALTTPNVRFPVESHTNAFFSHWSATWRDACPEFTRLLTRSQFARLLPSDGRIIGSELAPTFIAHSPPVPRT
jgi:hypothetical protein